MTICRYISTIPQKPLLGKTKLEAQFLSKMVITCNQNNRTLKKVTVELSDRQICQRAFCMQLLQVIIFVYPPPPPPPPPHILQPHRHGLWGGEGFNPSVRLISPSHHLAPTFERLISETTVSHIDEISANKIRIAILGRALYQLG